MKVHGRCHCGAITYEAIVDPALVRICHCTDCQMLTGSPFRANVSTTKGSFVLKSGEPKLYFKTADSGTRRAHAFCPNCGSPVYSAAADNTQPYSLRLGALAERHALLPTKQIWCKSALSWAMNLGNVPQVQHQ